MQTAIGHARILGTPVSSNNSSSETLARIQHALQRRTSFSEQTMDNSSSSNSIRNSFLSDSPGAVVVVSEKEKEQRGELGLCTNNMPDFDESPSSPKSSSNKSNNDEMKQMQHSDEDSSQNFENVDKLLSCPEKLGVAELHRTLERFRKQSEDTIQKLKQESEDASRTIEKLQQQLQQQSDYENLKQEIQMLKGGIGANSIEMILLERAKSLQANPALKAFADLQGSPFSGLANRHPLFPPIPGMDSLGGFMNEDVMHQWKRSLEQQAALLSPQGTTPSSRGLINPSSSPAPLRLSNTPLTPPSSAQCGFPLAASPPNNGRSPSSPDHHHHHPSSINDLIRPSVSPVTNGGGNSSKPASEDGGDGGNRIGSPSSVPPIFKMDTDSSSTSSPNNSNHNNNNNGVCLPFPNQMSSLPLIMPQMMSSNRIPKSDPMEARLQDMLRYNMEKYAGQALDTLGTSRRVRELLSVHNIGQRLFAKYVLGLSQGTVSELLSKPKSWEKLTEKGRDSYRKMHAWAYDEQAVLLLKTLIPRKGELVRPPSSAAAILMKDQSAMRSFPYGGGPSNDGSDDRITKILHDANKAMGKDQPILNHSSGGEETLQSAQERMSKIYQEELARLMNQGGKDLMNPASLFPLGEQLQQQGDFFLAVENPLAPGGPSPQEIQRAMDIYQQELGRIQQNAFAAALNAQNGGSNNNNNNIHSKEHQEESIPPTSGTPPTMTVVSSAETSPSIKLESKNMDSEDSSSQTGLTAKGSSLFPNLPPNTGIPNPTSGSASPVSGLPGIESISAVAALSPLQRMASITNSLVTQPPQTASSCGNSRPNRAILPPITQQQFDRFSHLNTDDTVRRIRDILSQYSISQRLFGENILGLSQGSVSDLLARPKPWHMLTQKGREPFIRMKLFLEDEHAVHKLVASQYKIAPEKLMRTGGYAGSPIYPPNSKQMPKLPDFPKSIMESPLTTSNTSSFPDRVGGELHSSLLDPLAIHRKILAQQQHQQHKNLPIPTSNISASPGGLVPSPSLYEMAALTQELDTQAITTKAKEVLLANNVGQKLFGESVLGLSQGSVSELLSKPKPWHMLSIKGREPFIRMQLWLNDPQNIEKLQLLKNEKLAKRKRGLPGSGDSNSDRSSPADASDMYHSGAESPGGGTGAKKPRALFTEEQKEGLKVAFALDPYPSNSTMEFLSQELNLESRSISNWFHNHRMRLKQHLPGAAENLALLSGKEGGLAFDPIKFRLLFHQRLLDITGASGEESVSALMRQMTTQSCGSGGNEGLDLRQRSEEQSDEDDDIADKESSDHEESSSRSNNPSSNISSSVGSRSRRKAAAPQWVRPEWMEDSPQGGNDQGSSSQQVAGQTCHPSSKSETINGVCVLNSYAFNKESNEDESIEDHPHESDSSSPNNNNNHSKGDDEDIN
ncbi:LOW QUALITY PROTEIN: homeobox protein cut [Lepeophtheirus salmonis]|uniref:LOW QUALITY PROTEIN: homeobox protein cut n=1 Tax=Lepeophtheirus salmonis TaxID=72036 RepID=UPI003AF3FA88